MKGASRVRVLCWLVLLGAVLQACSNFPDGTREPEKAPAAASSSTPAAAGSATRGGAGQATAPVRAAPPAVPPPPPAARPAPPPAEAPPPPSPLQTQMADGIRLFDQGEFYAAAGRLRNLPDLGSAPVETQITAIKYLAFSYCVTNRRTLCQQQFEAVLKLDPKFELAPAERGHPIWKVVFERAKTVHQRASSSPPAATKAATGTDAKGAAIKGADKAAPAKAQDAKTAPAKAQDAKTAPAKGQDQRAAPQKAVDGQAPKKSAKKSVQPAPESKAPPAPDPPPQTQQ